MIIIIVVVTLLVVRIIKDLVWIRSIAIVAEKYAVSAPIEMFYFAGNFAWLITHPNTWIAILWTRIVSGMSNLCEWASGYSDGEIGSFTIFGKELWSIVYPCQFEEDRSTQLYIFGIYFAYPEWQPIFSIWRDDPKAYRIHVQRETIEKCALFISHKCLYIYSGFIPGWSNDFLCRYFAHFLCNVSSYKNK